jgi:glycosyltransferase involved in cell wall biosynthesis
MYVFPRRHLKEVLKIARELKPDIILCYLIENMRLALLLRQYLKIPIVLHVENAGCYFSARFADSWRMRPVRRFLKMPTRAESLWSWACKEADAIITSRPRDQDLLGFLSKHGKPVYYLAWPTFLPENFEPPQSRDKYTGIYAGLLGAKKNTQVFQWLLPKILKETPTRKFTIIGLGSREHISMVKKLQQDLGEAIEYIPRLPRIEVLKLVAGSFYGYTSITGAPDTAIGVGFVGDCWGTGTPLLMSHNIYGSKELDAAVASDDAELICKINRLYEEVDYCQELQKIGYSQFNKRMPKVIAEGLLNILSDTLKKARSLT